jgi:hypothetical protein
LAAILVLSGSLVLRAQAPEDGIERPAPTPLERFETDANRDGVPDGWYNLRDARMIAEGGAIGPGFLRFQNERPGREARISRAFGVDGRKTEAVIIGLWVRLDKVLPGERVGDPGLAIDFLGSELRTQGRGTMGPWTHLIGRGWMRVAKRFNVPEATLDAITSIGLFGATGTMDIDGMTIDLVPRGGEPTTNLILGGDLELADPDPVGWFLERGARRACPGYRSSAALELTGSGARALNGLGVTVERLSSLEYLLMARGAGLRGAGGATASVFFVDAEGQPLPGYARGLLLFRWSGSFDWRQERTVIPVPSEAVRAVLQIEKLDASGSILIDDVKVAANPAPSAAEWTPYHVETDSSSWQPVSPSPEIVAGSALDASFLVSAPAGKQGFVETREARLAFENGGRAHFFGVAILPPAAFREGDAVVALADRLARSGVNLVRLGDLDTPLGPGRSLLDDSRDDTQALDPIALGRLEHLIAALKERGIYVALEFQSARRFRKEDGVAGYRGLPPGGGPAAGFDPRIRELELKTAEQLLEHVNPETKMPLRDDPVLAWVTLAGELTLFDLIDHPDLLPTESADLLKKLAQQHPAGTSRRFWQVTESAQWSELAQALRKAKLRVPIAGCSHWRRTPTEFDVVQAAEGLNLIDDRLFFSPASFALPDHRTFLRSAAGNLATVADKKRRSDRAYVVGQFAAQTDGAWALPYEGADLMLVAQTALHEDWDAIVRRGVFLYPEVWGANSTGTGTGDDFFQIGEAINGIPQVFALLPHASSIVLRGQERSTKSRTPSRAVTGRRSPPVVWNPQTGRLLIDTPFTQGLAGWPQGQPTAFEALAVDVDNPYAVVVATSMDSEPIANSKRLLVTAVARVEPTGFRWVDQSKREVADPGVAPLRQEPVRARVTWQRKGTIKAYALDNTGARKGEASLEKIQSGARLSIDGRAPTLHWELVVE